LGIYIRYLTVISIKQKYGGHAKRAAMALLGSTYGYHRRFVIIVDDDIDPSNIDDVLWALSTRCRPATAINVITEAWSTPLDPRITPDARAARNLPTPWRSSMLANHFIGRISTQKLATSGGDAQENVRQVEGSSEVGINNGVW